MSILDRPEKGFEPGQAKPERNRDQNRNPVHLAALSSRIALATTISDDSDMASAAIKGLTSPKMASGTATRLYPIAITKFCRTTACVLRAARMAAQTGARLPPRNTISAAFCPASLADAGAIEA